MRIEVYSSFMPDQPIEVVNWAGTFTEHLDELNPAWRYFAEPRVEVQVNGEVIPVERWGESFEEIHVTVLARGGLFKSIGSILGKVFNTLFGWMAPRRSGTSSNGTPEGSRIDTAQATANAAKLSQVVPELVGRHRRFPDYLTPPYRYFRNAREQWLEFHTCIGPGRYAVEADTVKLGNTPFDNLGPDATYAVFEPGQDLSGVDARNAWHTVAEVGGTSSGTAGLELTTDIGNRENLDPASYQFNGGRIQRDGEFPSAWGLGTVVNISYLRDYTSVNYDYTGESGYRITRITGPFGHLDADEGDVVQMTTGGFESPSAYRVRMVVSEAGVSRTLELETLEGAPVVFDPGTSLRAFGVNVARTIVEFSPSEIVVSPGGFAPGTVTGTQIRFAGGEAYGEWTSEFAASPGNEVSGTIEFDVFFPNGLATLRNDGTPVTRGVGIEFQYRNRNGGPRFTVTHYYENATVDQIGYTERIFTTAEHWLCRMRRIGAQSTESNIIDTVQWYGLKTLLVQKDSYPGWTTMFVRVRSGGKVSAQSENQVNLVATRFLPRLLPNGTWTAPEPTRDITATARHVLQTIGYGDTQIDVEEWLRLNALWQSRADTFDYVFDQTTAKAALDTVFAAGMGEFTVSDGLVRPVREEPRTTFEQSYSPQNMLPGSFKRSFRPAQHDDFDGVEMEYTDPVTWTRETVQCFLPGDQGFKIEKIPVDGVLDRTRAWRIGMRRRRGLRYRNGDYTFSTELDALNSEYKSYVPLFDDIPGYGKSALALAIVPLGDGRTKVFASERMDWTQPGPLVMGYRRLDGVFVGPFAATRGDSDSEIIATLPTPLPITSLRAEPIHVFFGSSPRFTFPALVTGISPSRNGKTVVATVEKYDDRVYSDDNNPAPN